MAPAKKGSSLSSDVESIKQLKARYLRLIDTKQWDELRLLFTADARFETGRGVFADPDSFVGSLRDLLAGAVTVHHGHTPEIVFHGPIIARAIWAMYDLVEWPDGDHDGFSGYGHYEEEYRKEGDEWRIAFLRLTRLRVDLVRGGHHPGVFPPARGTAWLERRE